MLKELKFVEGSVARKDFSPELVHFHIQGGKLQGYNGMLSLCCPIALDLDVTPNAVQMIKAIRGCHEAVAFSMTAGGKLAVKSGRFKAFVDCFSGGFPEIRPSGVRVELPPSFLPALRLLAPCVAEDASRQWARGVLFRGASAYATNNVVLMEYFLGTEFPAEVNIPLPAIQELLRIGEHPEAMLFATTAVTFLYSGERWMRAQLYTTEWPDLARVLDGDYEKVLPSVVTVEMLNELAPFVDDAGHVYFLENEIATSQTEGEGARLTVPGVLPGGVFNVKMLQLALTPKTRIDYSSYPAPCRFIGDSFRGCIIGMRS